MKFFLRLLLSTVLLLFTKNLEAQTCPADLTNEDASVEISPGNSYNWGGVAGVTGVSSAAETNGSPCALKLEQDGSAGSYNNWTIPIEMYTSVNNIEVGDQIEFSIDGNGISGNARVIVRSDASYDNLVIHTFGQGNGWETYTQTFTVPTGATRLSIFLYPNVGSTAPGASLYDNLVFRDVNGGNGNGGGTSYWTQNGSDINYSAGNVGIGTTSPDAKLDVNGSIRGQQFITVQTGGSYKVALNGQSDGYIRGRDNSFANKFQISANGNSYLNGGNVGIGTASPDAPLTVNGQIHAKEVKVDLLVPAPDYVFYDDYELRSLEEVQNYIDEYGHLPNIPSAAQMAKEGLHLKEMNLKLLEKIEELTLYILAQEKEQKLQKQKQEALQKKLDKVIERLERLDNP